MLAGASAAQTPALFPTRAFDAPGVYAADLPFFDVDGDGRDDAIGSQQYGTLPGALRWSRALPDATFAAPQPIGAVIGIAIAFVDADGDGDRDVYTQAGYSSSEYTCWRNDGGGVYVALTTVIVPGAGSTWAAIAHLDADPWPDLVVVAAQLPFPVDRLTWVYRGLPGAALSAPVQVGPHEPDSYAFTRVIDVDGQNGLDVLVASHLVPPYACLNDGAGNFGAAVSIPGPLGAAELLDANADGRADLLVDPDGTGPLRLSVCLSNFPAPFGAPIPLPTTQAGPIPRALDANGDAFPDVWYGTQSGGAWPTCQIFYGSSSGHYTASPTFPFFALDARFDDLDGDGLPELLTTGSSLSVTAGNFGSLAPWERVLQPPISDYGLDASDLDADGRADLVFSRTGHWLRVAMGAAGGQFHELAVGVSTNSIDLVLADADDDGRADLIGTHASGKVLQWYAGAGDGTFAPPVSSSVLTPKLPLFVEPADFDGDGRIDACVSVDATWDSTGAGIMKGAGDGSFLSWTALPGSQMEARPGIPVDLNSDGFPDPHLLALVGTGPPGQRVLQWWLSDGVGGYGPAQQLLAGQLFARVPVGDFDADGHADLAIARSNSKIELRYGDGTGSLAALTPVAMPIQAWPLRAADLDLDGRDDLVCASKAGSSLTGDVQIVFGGAVGVPPLIERYLAPSTDDVVALDVDLDGRLDLITDAAALVRNVSPRAAGASGFGTGTPGCAGIQVLTAALAPKVGASEFLLTCHGAPPQAIGLGLIGSLSDPGSDPLGIGLLAHVDFAAPCVPFYAHSSVSGSASRRLPIPSDPFLAGAVLHAQLLWPWAPSANCDPSPLLWSSTSGLTLTIQP